jgi:tRNA (adenine22-N1)-methyltransferase
VKNKRISRIINRIITNGIVVDVGSDHAQLAIQLLTEQKAKHVYNIEINPKPLEITIKNLQRSGFFDKTTNILGDGLKKSFVAKKVDYCIIAGMGANNIVQIISQKNPRNKIQNFILVPNNHPEILRKYLQRNKYRISYEETIQDKDYYYQLIQVSKTQGLIIKNKQAVYFGPYNLAHPTVAFVKMYSQRMQYLQDNNLYLHSVHLTKEFKLLKAQEL